MFVMLPEVTGKGSMVAPRAPARLEYMLVRVMDDKGRGERGHE
jgi:hypothetical protein